MSKIETGEVPNCEGDVEVDDEVGLATLEPVEPVGQPPTEWNGPRCEKCSAPLKSDVVTICRKCGWYASLGTFVEVDPDWETYQDSAKPQRTAVSKSQFRLVIELVPRWGWIVIASVFAVVVESVVARFVTPPGSPLRTMWSLTHLLIGALTVFACHVFNFLQLAAEDSEFGVLDMALRPLRLWARTCQRLPQRLRLFNSLVCGLTAVVMSLFVIGGIPYERLWDWGFKQPPKHNLMGAIMDRAKQLEDRKEADNLEEAIADFAGNGEAGGEEIKPEAQSPREKADCVILGYELDRDRRLESLLLGRAHGKKLVFAGRVTPEMSEAEKNSLVEAMKPSIIVQPFIRIAADSAVWVRPQFTCRVSYGEKSSDGHLRDIKWVELIGIVRTKR